MKLPRDNKKLDEIYKNSSESTINEFEGDYKVIMLTGSIPNFSWAGHSKRFYMKDGNKIGHNYALLFFTFGHFRVEDGVCDDFSDMKAVVLNYGKDHNIITKYILDKLRKIEEGTYLGRFYSLKSGKPVFAGYFGLIKK